jgi:hypothetical protein
LGPRRATFVQTLVTLRAVRRGCGIAEIASKVFSALWAALNGHKK